MIKDKLKIKKKEHQYVSFTFLIGEMKIVLYLKKVIKDDRIKTCKRPSKVQL